MMVVLTNRDWDLIRTTNSNDADTLQRVLDARYQLGLTLSLFGEFSDTVYVYVNR